VDRNLFELFFGKGVAKEAQRGNLTAVTTTPIRPTAAPTPDPDRRVEASAAGLVEQITAAIGDLAAHHDSGALLDVAEVVLDRLGAQPLAGGVDDDALHDSVRRLARCEARVAAEKLRRIGQIAERESFRADAERSAADWVADQTGASRREARIQANVAAALDRLPAVAAQCAAGTLTPGHAAAAARALTVLDRHAHNAELNADSEDERAAVVADAAQAVIELDRFVASRAGAVDADRLNADIKAWMIQRQPAAEEHGQARALANRGLRWLPQRDADGCHTAIFKTTDEGRAQLDAAVAPLSAKTSEHDDRSLAQRQHDALVSVARQACDRGEPATATATRGRVLLTGSRAAMDGDADAEPMWLDGVGPVGSATAQAIACDADTTDIIYDTDRNTWIVGRANGDPSPKQRAVVIARDRVCVGCKAPASRCQIHHIIYRSHNGKTVIDNLVLVCWSCHQGLHHLGWTITRAADGTFAITKRKRRAG
jgi:hypothetical protein